MRTDADNHPLRVSVVEPSGQLYGSELALLDLAERLNPSKFQVEVVLPYEAPFATSLRKAQIRAIHLLPAQLKHRSRWRKAWCYLQLLWHWKNHRPNLIYVNQGGILRPVAALARKLQLPVVCQVQTVEDARWVSSISQCHPQVMTFICNSQFVAAMTRVPVDRLSTIYYGYKHKGLARSDRQPFESSRPLRIGLLGRICRSKGHHLLVEAASQLKRLASGRFHFQFIGDALNPDELSSLKALILRLDVGDTIEFHGYRSDIAAELANLDALAVPSIEEPFGRILCEAAEASVPVLVSDSGGLGELSRRFDVGLRFRGGDAEDLARQLQLIRADYPTIECHFKADARRLLFALNLTGYIARIEELLISAAAGKPASIEWLGSPAKEEFSNAATTVQPFLS